MFLIRSVFWIGLAVLLLPSDEKRQAELYGRATAVAAWTISFCDRNGETCAMSAGLWQTFKHKAEFGMRMAGDMLQKGMSAPQPLRVPPADQSYDGSFQPAGGRGSLAPDDMQPRWRARSARQPGA